MTLSATEHSASVLIGLAVADIATSFQRLARSRLAVKIN